MRRTSLVGIVAAAALGSCGHPPPPAPPVIPPPPPPVVVAPPPPPPCVAVPDDDAAITHAAVDGTRIGYCVGAGSDRCYALDLADGSAGLAKLAGPPVGPAPVASTAHVETTNPELKVCTPSACTALTPSIMPGTTPLHAATNAAGTYAVVLLGDDVAGKGYAEAWDVAASKRLSVIRYARGSYRCGEPAFLGDTVLITARACAVPAARGALYTVKGRKIANVGNADFGLYGDAYVHLAGTTWAFLGENGHHIAIQDVAKGKVLKMIDTGALWARADAAPGEATGEAMGNPGESALLALPDGKLAIVAGSPANGSVAVVDVETGAVAVTRAPLCAP